MNKRAFIAAMLPLLATGCSSMLNTADNDTFSCPGMPQGIICKTPMAVYKSTNQMPRPTDSDLPFGSKSVGVQAGDDQGNVARPELATKVSAGVPGQTSTSSSMARPVRTPAQVMRIWIAPWIDSKDDLHYPSYLYTEVQPRRWSFGKTEFAGKGMVVPHRELAAVAPVPQDPSRPNGKPAAQKTPGGDVQQAGVGQAYPGTDVSALGMPSPSDINLD
ncbi:type IV conjugative transfer system lipoprotein TraV [Cupriavidus sp. TMH.W2]|uniref:type IV conjugative transfer system lipoprotein TraV n=1 Tax=Cupriavidus sp. TMH.W2 TaxID=3434465 RepID=UPI003D78A69A